jgi:CheY-like chemotaxis protein
MWPLVEECLQLVTPMAQRRGLHWQLVPLDAALHVRADATRLKQVLLNLLSNAIKYNREGCSVQLVGAIDGDHLVLSVRDEGPGLTEAQQQRLFHAFERLDAQHSTIEGTGIGLALSRQLVDSMAGEIGVQSVAGEGSCFWVRLPRCDAPLPQAAGRPAEAMPPPPSQSRRVLYIEDNDVNQLLMAGMLARRPSIGLDMASLPEEGLRLAAESRYDLILLDIQLPGIDGLEVLRRLRAAPATARVPVVAVSANAMHSDLEAAHAAGFDEYLTKPLEMRTLLTVVDRFLSGA